MLRIKDTKLVILDQTWVNEKKYVGVDDLVQWLEEGITKTKKSRKPYVRKYGKFYIKAWEKVANKMRDLLINDGVNCNIPSKYIVKA